METIRIILDILTVVGVMFISMYIKDLPNLTRELRLQNNKHKHEDTMQEKDHMHTHKLQKEAYYNQMAGKQIEDLFNRLTDLFISDDKTATFSAEDAKEISKLVFMYGSKETIEIFSTYMNGLYTEKPQKELSDIYNQYQLYIFSEILSNIKYDFTGYKINPLTFLKSKITDYDSVFTDEVVNRIKKYISKNDR